MAMIIQPAMDPVSAILFMYLILHMRIRCHGIPMMANKQIKKCEVFNLGPEWSNSTGSIKAFEKVSGVKLNYVIGPRRPEM